jgi:adenylyltransferase/sulfurtransferase
MDHARVMSLSAAELARYSRHLALPEVGAAGQARLRAAKVLVIGAGGLGSPAALYLAAAGIGTLGIVDCDRVELSNLQRQILFSSNDVGAEKASAAADRLTALNPHVDVRAHVLELRAANVRGTLGDYDVVLDGTDRIATRYLVNDACVQLQKPLVSAAIHRFEGQAMTYVPGKGPCYRCLFPEPSAEGLVPNCATAGVLGVLPGVMGAIQATEAIKLITRAGTLLVGRLLIYDALEMRSTEFRFSARRDCAICGDHPTIVDLAAAHPDRGVPAGPAADDAQLVRLSPEQLRRLIDAPPRGTSIALIDVREPHEFEAGHLPEAVNAPIGQLESWGEPRVAQLCAGRYPVFLCRSGARSERAAAVARRAGLGAYAHLEGGMLAWGAEIDPNLIII